MRIFREQYRLIARWFVLHQEVLIILCHRQLKRWALLCGEYLKNKGRRLVHWGEEGKTITLGRELFVRCSIDCPDAELHTREMVYQGNLYGVRRGLLGDTILLKFAWVAARPQFTLGGWKLLSKRNYHVLVVASPVLLDTGDVYFSHSDGWVKLLLGPNNKLLIPPTS